MSATASTLRILDSQDHQNDTPTAMPMEATISIRIHGLDPLPFQTLFALDEAALHARGMRRVIVPEAPGLNYPCRISLDFASAGDELLLVNYRHLDQPHSPYRAEGPIFIRRDAVAFAGMNRFPPVIMQRPMSVRGYDADGMMLEGEVAGGEALQALVREWLARSDIAHVDVHSARRGCFFCRIYRA